MNSRCTELSERVVLVDPAGAPIGEADKATVHNTNTPFHLAFSCYVFNESGQLLLTRRALSKLTWPGVWSNSFCGHPAPGEPFEDAIARRAAFELGIELAAIQVELPEFTYRAVDASGVVEHEFCPVFNARIIGEPKPNPAEVMEFAWVDFAELTEAALNVPQLLSPWAVLQLPLLQDVRRAKAPDDWCTPRDLNPEPTD